MAFKQLLNASALTARAFAALTRPIKSKPCPLFPLPLSSRASSLPPPIPRFQCSITVAVVPRSSSVPHRSHRCSSPSFSPWFCPNWSLLTVLSLPSSPPPTMNPSEPSPDAADTFNRIEVYSSTSPCPRFSLPRTESLFQRAPFRWPWRRHGAVTPVSTRALVLCPTESRLSCSSSRCSLFGKRWLESPYRRVPPCSGHRWPW